MKELEQIAGLNITYVVIGIILIAVCVKFIYEVFEWLFAKFGIEFKNVREKKEQAELLKSNMEKIKELDKKYDDNSDKLSELARLVVDKQIDDMRWEILNFAAMIRTNNYNKEVYDHILEQYTKYEEILKKHNMTNGRVNASMKYIEEQYSEHLKNGF